MLKTALPDLIEKDGVRSFYVGNQAPFDDRVLRQLTELKKTHGHAAAFKEPADKQGKTVITL